MENSSFLKVSARSRFYFVAHIDVSLCIFLGKNMDNDGIYEELRKYRITVKGTVLGFKNITNGISIECIST